MENYDTPDKTGKEVLNFKLPVSEATMIGIFTLVGYLSAYLFQLGYYSYFSIPYYFIQIGVTNVLEFAGFIFLYIYIAFGFVEASLMMTASSASHVRGTVVAVMISIFGMFIPLGAIIFNPFRPILTGSIILILVVLGISILIMAHHSRETVLSALRSFSNLQKHGIIGSIERTSGKGQTFIFLPLIILVIFSFILGYSIARDRQTFLVTNTQPEYIVIGIYSNAFLALPVNSQLKSFEKEIKLIGTDQIESNSITLTSKKVGPLHNTEDHRAFLELLFL